MIQDPGKPKKFSDKIEDIGKSLERDYPGFKAYHKKGTKSEFSMFKEGKSFSVTRKVAHPGKKDYATGKDIAKAINSNKKNK
jgi:hypothetical protein